MRSMLPAAVDPASTVVAGLRDDLRAPVISRGDLHLVEIVAEVRKWFPALAKKLSKDKPSAAVHHLIGGDVIAKIRTVYDWCAGKVDPPALAIIQLLHTDAGWTVLEYLMRGCKKRWWLDVVRARECSLAYEARREQLDLLEVGEVTKRV